MVASRARVEGGPRDRARKEKNKKHVILERPARGVVGIEHGMDSQTSVLQTARVHDRLVVDVGLAQDGRRPLFRLARHQCTKRYLELLLSLCLH